MDLKDYKKKPQDLFAANALKYDKTNRKNGTAYIDDNAKIEDGLKYLNESSSPLLNYTLSEIEKFLNRDFPVPDYDPALDYEQYACFVYNGKVAQALEKIPAGQIRPQSFYYINEHQDQNYTRYPSKEEFFQISSLDDALKDYFVKSSCFSDKTHNDILATTVASYLDDAEPIIHHENDNSIQIYKAEAIENGKFKGHYYKKMIFVNTSNTKIYYIINKNIFLQFPETALIKINKGYDDMKISEQSDFELASVLAKSFVPNSYLFFDKAVIKEIGDNRFVIEHLFKVSPVEFDQIVLDYEKYKVYILDQNINENPNESQLENLPNFNFQYKVLNEHNQDITLYKRGYEIIGRSREVIAEINLAKNTPISVRAEDGKIYILYSKDGVTLDCVEFDKRIFRFRVVKKGIVVPDAKFASSEYDLSAMPNFGQFVAGKALFWISINHIDFSAALFDITTLTFGNVLAKNSAEYKYCCAGYSYDKKQKKLTQYNASLDASEEFSAFKGWSGWELYRSVSRYSLYAKQYNSQFAVTLDKKDENKNGFDQGKQYYARNSKTDMRDDGESYNYQEGKKKIIVSPSGDWFLYLSKSIEEKFVKPGKDKYSGFGIFKFDSIKQAFETKDTGAIFPISVARNWAWCVRYDKTPLTYQSSSGSHSGNWMSGSTYYTAFGGSGKGGASVNYILENSADLGKYRIKFAASHTWNPPQYYYYPVDAHIIITGYEFYVPGSNEVYSTNSKWILDL